MILSLRRFIAFHLPALSAMPLVAVLAVSPWTLHLSPSAVVIQATLFVLTCLLIFAAGRPVAAQRRACFDWQRELAGLRQEAASRAEMMQRLSDSIGGIGQTKAPPPV